MTAETLLSDGQIRVLFKSVSQEDYTKEGWVGRQRIAIGRAIEQAVLQSPEVKALREGSELGDVAMRFVDRAGDHRKEDPAERICDEFHRAMADVVDRHGAMRGMPSGKYDSTGNLK